MKRNLVSSVKGPASAIHPTQNKHAAQINSDWT